MDFLRIRWWSILLFKFFFFCSQCPKQYIFQFKNIIYKYFFFIRKRNIRFCLKFPFVFKNNYWKWRLLFRFQTKRTFCFPVWKNENETSFFPALSKKLPNTTCIPGFPNAEGSTPPPLPAPSMREGDLTFFSTSIFFFNLMYSFCQKMSSQSYTISCVL